MKPVVLLAVKDHRRAKQRLAACLSRQERFELCRAMWSDVSSVLRRLRFPVAVVSDSPETASEVRSIGWRLIEDNLRISESAAVDLASRELAREGFDTVLRLPADIPLIRAADVASLLDGVSSPPFARLVPSGDGTGTNALLRSPPELFPSRFGTNSLLLHLQEARRAGVEPEVVCNPRIALDVDEEADLRSLLKLRPSVATYRMLAQTGLGERLEVTSLA